MFILTRCRVSFALCCTVVLFTRPEFASDIHLILQKECMICLRMKPY